MWTFLYGVWFRGLEILQNIQNCGPFSTLRGSEFQLFKKKIQHFGPFSKGRGLDLQIFNKTSKIVDLFGKPLGQRSRYFTKDPKLLTFLSGAWLRGPWYSTKHPKLWTFLSDTWLRGIDIKIQNSGLFFLRRVVQRIRYFNLLKCQNCGPFVCRWVRDPDISWKIQNSGPVFRAHGSEVQIFHERSRTVDLVVHRWVRGPGIFIKF